jgi:hypothetical protein
MGSWRREPPALLSEDIAAGQYRPSRTVMPRSHNYKRRHESAVANLNYRAIFIAGSLHPLWPKEPLHPETSAACRLSGLESGALKM